MKRISYKIDISTSIAAGLIGVWLLVLAGVPAFLPTQPASWLTLLALLIAPGYLLGDIVTSRLRLDWLERLALAFPLGVVVLVVPGLVALLRHWTIDALVVGWIAASAGVVVLWLLRVVVLRPLAGFFDNLLTPLATDDDAEDGWAIDEIAMLVALLLVFALLIPLLTLYKIDGDAYAVSTFAADALAGRPLNATEPLFGTSLGPGVRMLFNQSLPMAYLWSYLSGIDPITLTATASRAMIALWALFAAYTLGKAAGDSRRLGLLVASVQLLIYLAAPFLRGDNVSLFFFERTSADKFMVPATMLPVVFAFALRFVRDGRREAWVTATFASAAISFIHPLIAAMCALALGAFGLVHLLVDLRNRVALRRSLAVWVLAALVMVVPLVQLAIAQDAAPLAPSYPDNVEGWPLGERLVPVLPFVELPTLDLYGPAPELADLEPSDANTTMNPFLMWRFDVNMDRRRLIMFDIDSYISDPNLLFEPPYLLALLLVPVLLWRIRSHVAAQFAVGTTLAVLFVMFNPIVTPLIGSLVMPWILWRFVWLLPYALIIALVVHWLLTDGFRAIVSRFSRNEPQHVYNLSLPLLIGVGFMLAPSIIRNVENLQGRVAAPYFYPAPEGIFDRLEQETAGTDGVMVLADQEVSVSMPAYVANAHVLAHREPTTSEVFPANQQDVALRRLIDQHSFFESSYLTPEAVDMLRRYDVQYVVTASGSDMDTQLRLMPAAFEWLMDDHSYSLYRVHQVPAVTAGIEGNAALTARSWNEAEQYFTTALEQSPDDLIAAYGLARIAHIRGQFDDALIRLQQINARVSIPHVMYQIGRLHVERGNISDSIAAFQQAQQNAPEISRFHIALGDACLRAEREDCAATQYEAAAASQQLPDVSARLIAEADLWRRRSRFDRALPLYEEAVQLRPSEYNQFVLVSAYREAGRYDSAEQLLATLREDHPLYAEGFAVTADVLASRGQTAEAVALYERAIWIQQIQGLDPTATYLGLAQALLDAGRLDTAQTTLDEVLRRQPHNATAYRVQGDLHSRRQASERAAQAYRRALELDPTQISVSTALRDQLRQAGSRPGDVLDLLRVAIEETEHATLYIALGDQLQRQGDVGGAVEAYRAALDAIDSDVSPATVQPSASSRAFASARLAEAYEDLGRIEPAMNYYRAAASAEPDAAWAHVLLGDALRRHNRRDTAVTAYQQAISVDASYLEAYMRLAEVHTAAGNATEAERVYQQAAQITDLAAGAEPAADSRGKLGYVVQLPSPTLVSGETVGLPATPLQQEASLPRRENGDVNRVNTLAQLYQRLGRFEQARTLYTEKIQEGEKSDMPATLLARYYKGLADLYFVEGDREAAINAYSVAVDLDKWWPASRLGLAQVLAESGNEDAALKHLQAAAETGPGSVDVKIALANMLQQQGREDPALEIYQRTVETHPGNVQALLGMARAWHAREQWDTAERYYREAVAMAAGQPEGYLGLAELYIERNRYDAAESELEQALAVDQSNANVYIRRGDVERGRSNFQRALDWYQRAEEFGAATQSARIAVTDALLENGDYDAALASVQSMLAQTPQDADVLLRLGRIQRALGDYGAASAALTEASRLQPENARILGELAETFRSQGQLQNARQMYEQAIEVNPQETSSYLSLSQVLAVQGQYDAAIRVLNEALGTVSEPADIYAGLASLHLQQAQHEQARQVLERGIAALDEQEPLLLALGAYHEARAEFDLAGQQYRRALMLNADAAAARAALGDLYLQMERIDEALAQYQQAVAAAPETSRYHLLIARAYAGADQIDAAMHAYSDTIAAAPTDEAAYIELASLYEEQEQWEPARSVYERGREKVPTSGRLLVRYGGFLLKQGETERGSALLEEAMTIAPTIETRIARAGVYREQGRLEEAEQELRLAVKSDSSSYDALIALGDVLHEQGETDAAVETYEQAISLRPGAAAGYLRLVGLALDDNEREQVEAYRERAREAVPGALVDEDGDS